MTLPKYDKPIPPPPYTMVLYDRFGKKVIHKAPALRYYELTIADQVEIDKSQLSGSKNCLRGNYPMPERFPKPLFKRFDSFVADYLIALSVCVIIAVIVFAMR